MKQDLESSKIKHLKWMLDNLPNSLEKRNRWIGFMQGVFWTIDKVTLEELKSAVRNNEHIKQLRDLIEDL